MFFKNSLLRVLSASAVQSPILGSQESLKTPFSKCARPYHAIPEPKVDFEIRIL